jgi:hypothetical protein
MCLARGGQVRLLKRVSEYWPEEPQVPPLRSGWQFKLRGKYLSLKIFGFNKIVIPTVVERLSGLSRLRDRLVVEKTRTGPLGKRKRFPLSPNAAAAGIVS